MRFRGSLVSNFVYHFRYKKIFASEFVTVYSELGNLAQSWQMGFRSSSLVSNFGANRSTLVFSSSELLGVAGGGLDLRVGGWQSALLLRNLPPFIWPSSKLSKRDSVAAWLVISGIVFGTYRRFEICYHLLETWKPCSKLSKCDSEAAWLVISRIIFYTNNSFGIFHRLIGTWEPC